VICFGVWSVGIFAWCPSGACVGNPTPVASRWPGASWSNLAETAHRIGTRAQQALGGPRDKDAEDVADATRDRAPGRGRRVSLDEALASRDPREVCGRPIYLATDLLFDFDDDALRPDAIPEMEELRDLLLRTDARMPPQMPILLEGHADRAGSSPYNLDLSARRARSVRNWLIGQGGVPPERLQAVGRGDTQPIVDAPNKDLQYLNRRVEVLIGCPPEPKAN
jgi:outer membrane protein OmpA-like peptidoglycan-associated protein